MNPLDFDVHLKFAILEDTPVSQTQANANFAWGQQSGAWGAAGNANFPGVKATLLGVCLG